ncbi:MAG: FeoC-like transcriptional regulator [Anaerolineae bacterium]|nr:FeoC-like transcriptional regulator [Anaerolineae bacterium]
MLRLLGAGGIHSTAELAQRLGVSQELVRLMAEDLVRRGYLVASGDGCSTRCTGCQLADMCGQANAPGANPALLMLTAKR